MMEEDAKASTISKTEVSTIINTAISTWLKESADAKLKKEKETDTIRWLSREDDENRYRNMAWALFDVGRQLGVLDADDYPVFRN